jgi:hypothetical protein
MPVETRAQLTARYLEVVRAAPLGTGLLTAEDWDLEVAGSAPDEVPLQRGGWWEEEASSMASGTGAEGRQRFSGKKGDGLTHKQFELMVKGSLADRFKKLQKDVGNPVEGAEFKQKYCIYLGEFLDNPAKLAHEREYEAHNLKADPVGALLVSLKRHFEDHKEGKAQEWVAFKRESGEELPTLLFPLQGLALDLEKSLGDQELVVKFVTALDRRLGEQTSTQAMAATLQSGGAYTLDEAYEAALMVSATNSRLRIAKELLPRAVGADAARSRWGPRAPAVAHVAILEHAPMAAAAPPGGPGASGACHNCGEQGHYRGSCPHPKRNSSGGRGGGGRGGGRTRACYICGDVNHLAAQCAKRVVPAPVAAVAAQGPQSVSDSEFAEFQAWRARTQAAAATGVALGAEDEDGGEWDDQEYKMGAVALPVQQVQAQRQGLVMAAAGTKAGAEKARATRAARKGADPAVPLQQAPRPATRSPVGTAQIAGPVDLAALNALQSRQDKLAAKERLAKLPDHGRNVAPQGLNRLPKGFPVGGGVAEAQRPRVTQQVGTTGPALRQNVVAVSVGAESARVHMTGRGAEVLGLPTGEVSPALTKGVTLTVLSFLELAGRVGLDLAAVTSMARGAQPRDQDQALAVQPIRLPADGAVMARILGADTGGSGPAVSAGRLSPIAVRAQEARAKGGAALGSTGGARPGPEREARARSGVVTAGEQAESSAMGAARGAGEGSAWGSGAAVTQGNAEQGESSAMGAARGAIEADERVARALAAQERVEQAAMQGELVTSISRDAELAMKLVAQDARANGVSASEALEAQAARCRVNGPRQVEVPAGARGKEKVFSSVPTAEEQDAVLAWEKMLSKGDWIGADKLAEEMVLWRGQP